MDVFRSLEVPKEKRENTYIPTFLSCWLCAFVLPKTEEKFIRPGTFEVASLMTSGITFSLAIPMLASIYCGLNGITKVAKPSHCFPASTTTDSLPPISRLTMYCSPLSGPLIVHYSGSQITCSDIGDARELIHERKVSDLGCLLLGEETDQRSLLTMEI